MREIFNKNIEEISEVFKKINLRFKRFIEKLKLIFFIRKYIVIVLVYFFVKGGVSCYNKDLGIYIFDCEYDD